MMITGVTETFAICRVYRFHWPWFSLFKPSFDFHYSSHWPWFSFWA